MTAPRTDPFAELRAREFPAMRDGIYLNAASITPLPERARAAAEAYNELRARAHEMRDSDFTEPVAAARKLCARLIGADPSEIALGGNTSFGINLAALGLEVPHGSVVVTSDREFPANVYPWMGRDHIRLECVPVDDRGWPDVDRLLDRIQDPRVSVLTISSVQFASGYRADLAELGEACRRSGTFFVVDAIQSLGILPLDVSSLHVDVLATGAQKWLCGPLGVGFVYVRREIQPRLAPSDVGWLSMEASQRIDRLLDYRWSLLDDARRYEVATAPLQEYRALAASVELIMEADVAAIWAYVDGLLDPLRAWLREHPHVAASSPLEGDRRSAIVAFVPPGDVERTYGALRGAGVVCSLREGAIRVAPHFYNTAGDVGAVVETLDRLEREGWE